MSAPSSIEAAFVIASTYRQLGGWLTIDSNGHRYFGRAEPSLYLDQGQSIPQLPGASPSRLFHTPDEWNGAIKLLEAMIVNLSAEDREFIFALFAPVCVDDRKLTQSIEEPRREQRQ